jgi:hypothetical protein
LARHAMETGELDIHRTAIGGDSVDLGGFRQYVHRREAARRFEWAGEIDVSQLRGRLVELLAPVHQRHRLTERWYSARKPRGTSPGRDPWGDVIRNRGRWRQFAPDESTA